MECPCRSCVTARLAATERDLAKLKIIALAVRQWEGSLPDKRVRELAECDNPGPYVKALAAEVLRLREAIAALEVKC